MVEAVHHDGEQLHSHLVRWLLARTDSCFAVAGVRQMQTFFLAKHVFACRCTEKIIFLDLHNDRYLALHDSAASSLAKFVFGWQPESEIKLVGADAGHESFTADSEAVKLLCNKGLLTRDCSLGKHASVPVPVSPEVEFDAADGVTEFHTSALEIFYFLLSTLIALTLRITLPLEQCLAAVQMLKRRKLTRSYTDDSAVIRRIVTVYSRLRPLAFKGKGCCLFECLVLHLFLMWHGIPTTWVFAVQCEPFTAHCWLQYKNAVINDSLENVREFVPIMSV